MCAGEGRGVVSGQLWGPMGLGLGGDSRPSVLGSDSLAPPSTTKKPGGSPQRSVSGRVEEGQVACPRSPGACAMLPHCTPASGPLHVL